MSTENLIIVYVFLFFVVNFAGLTFLSESVWAPYLETSSTSAPDGSAWIESDNLVWAYSGTANYILSDGSDVNTGSFSTSGPAGSVWIDGSRVYYIDENGEGRWVEGELVEGGTSSDSGSFWVDSRTGLLHYIDESGDHRKMLERYFLLFDGDNDRVTVDSLPYEDPPQEFTAESWFKMGDTPAESWASVFSTRNGGDGDGFWIFVDSGEFPLDISYSLDFKDASRVHSSLQFNDQIEQGEWYHVALVWDGSEVSAYLDGDLLGTYDASGEEAEVANELAMGYDLLNDYPLEGRIESTRLWDRALTQSEIQDSMNRKMIGDEENLVGYWSMDEGSGSVTADKTGVTGDGNIDGASWMRVSTLD